MIDTGLAILIIGSLYLAHRTGMGLLTLVAAGGFLALAFDSADEPILMIVFIGAGAFLFYKTFFVEVI